MNDVNYIEQKRISGNIFRSIKGAFIASLYDSSVTYYHDHNGQEYAFYNGERITVDIITRNAPPKRLNLLFSSSK